MNILFPAFAPTVALAPTPWLPQMPTALPQMQAPVLDLARMEATLMTQLLGMLATLMGSPSTLNGGGGTTDSSTSGGGSASGNSSGGQAVDPSQFQGGTDMGRKLAAAALKESTDGDSKGGWCARDVGEALRAVGLGVARGDAWTKAEVLAKDNRFQEIKVAPDQIDKLPPGAIIVWDKGPGLPYGHISIALGDGREASDLLRKQMHLKTSFRVFMPK